jgi:pimeloyl-ACP methyl ester carboxylesterase
MEIDTAPPQGRVPVYTSAIGEDLAMWAYQEVMGAWPVPHKDLIIGTSFGDTHVIASGPPEKPPLVLLHALFATAASWYRNVEHLSQSYRTFCVDVIGEGNMSHPTAPIASLDQFLRWFTEVLDGLGIHTLNLVGNSYGGFTAAYYAMQLPERILKLVLIGPAATIHPMRPFMLHMFTPKALYLAAPRLPGAARAMRHAVDWMHAGLEPDPLWEPLFYETLVNGKLINRVMPRVYTREELARIRSETLLMFGDREVIYGDLEAAIAAGQTLIPNTRVAVIPDAHHIAALANPEAANQCLIEFLDHGAEALPRSHGQRATVPYTPSREA